jgi:hypothetical protein
VDQSLGHVLGADNENNPPLYYLLAWAAAKLGDPAFAIRLPAVLFGTATVPVVYALGRRTVGSVPGLVAAAMVAIAPFGLFYGTEARAYSALMFFTALSTLALVSALGSGRRAWWALYVLASVGTLYTHYLGALVLAAQVIWALAAHRGQAARLLGANVAVALLCIPLLPSLLGGRSLPAPGHAPSAETVWAQTLRLLPGHPLLPTSDLPGLVAMIAFAVALAVAVLALLLRAGRGAEWRSLALLGLIVVTAFGGFLLYAIAGEAYFLSRYLGMALPAAVLLIGWLLTRGPRPVATAAVVLALGALAVGTVASFADDSRRPDFKDAAALVDREAHRGDVVVDPEVRRTIAYRAFLPVLGTARQTKFSVYMDRPGVTTAGTLVDAVARTSPGRRIYVVETRDLVEKAAGLPLKPEGAVTFDGVEPVRLLAYTRVEGTQPEHGTVDVVVPDEAKVAHTRQCLIDHKLPARFADSPPGAVTLKYDIPSYGSGVVIMFASAEEAEAALDGIRSVLGTHGGRAWTRGDVIIGFTERPNAQRRRALDPCT